MTDEQLAIKAQSGDESSVNELLTKYKPLVSKLSRSYFLTDGDSEDILQEGMIGLYKAIRHYDKNKNASFKTFASTCIKHQLQSAIKIASAEKHKVLSTALSINDPSQDDEDGELEIYIPSSLPSPDDKLLERERMSEIKQKIKEVLSSLELEVLSLYLKGYNYNEISSISKLSKKSIDNALTRIKNKLSFLKNKN